MANRYWYTWLNVWRVNRVNQTTVCYCSFLNGLRSICKIECPAVMIASQGTDSFDVLTIPVRSISGQFIKNLEYILDFFGLFGAREVFCV